jgi:hypothetical protein
VRASLSHPTFYRLLFFLATLAGCAGYRVGTASLYPPDVQTVYVPMFESDSLRRGLSERLTEAVIKEIELKTPYKVISSPEADSVLTGRITNDIKRVIVEDFYDQPRQVDTTLQAQVNWVNRRGDRIGNQGDVPIPSSLVELSSSGKQVAEYGQSISTAQQQAINRMAEQIVALMESPW